MSRRPVPPKKAAPKRAASAKPSAPARRAARAGAPRPPSIAARADEPAKTPTHRFIVLTGLSGAGKSQAMRALEDLAYFCVDNLPITLLPIFAELTMRPDTEIDKAAVVILSLIHI